MWRVGGTRRRKRDSRVEPGRLQRRDLHRSQPASSSAAAVCSSRGRSEKVSAGRTKGGTGGESRASSRREGDSRVRRLARSAKCIHQGRGGSPTEAASG